MKEYKDFTDEQLIVMLRGGEQEIVDYIMEKYKNVAKYKAKEMFLLGGDNDDLIQEGMIGLFKAIQNYNKEAGASFQSFANLCISRQIYSAIEAAKRKKHSPLNSYVPLESNVLERAEYTLGVTPKMLQNPEDLYLGEQNKKNILDEIDKDLSQLERQVLYLYIAGNDYKSIARLLDKSDKAIDNALQRIKQKASKIVKK